MFRHTLEEVKKGFLLFHEEALNLGLAKETRLPFLRNSANPSFAFLLFRQHARPKHMHTYTNGTWRRERFRGVSMDRQYSFQLISI
jgi:hypothetical protein